MKLPDSTNLLRNTRVRNSFITPDIFRYHSIYYNLQHQDDAVQLPPNGHLDMHAAKLEYLNIYSCTDRQFQANQHMRNNSIIQKLWQYCATA